MLIMFAFKKLSETFKKQKRLLNILSALLGFIFCCLCVLIGTEVNF